MKISSFIFCLILLLTSSPLRAGNWAEDLFEWVADLFGGKDESVAPEIIYSEAQLDSLTSTPLGLILHPVPDSDTLAVEDNWPHLSLTVERDLATHLSLLRETILLANPKAVLPLVNIPAVRIIYRSDQRPDFLLATARRFTDVQEISYDVLLPGLLPYAADLPTIIVADNPKNLAPLNADWYRPLTKMKMPQTTFLHFGDPALLSDIPKEWPLITCTKRVRESEQFLAQALFGAQVLDARLAKSTPDYPAGAGQRLEAVIGGFRLPELLGIDRTAFERIDYHINRGIRYRAMPGAQLVVMKDGHVVYEKAYGHHVYRKQEVNPGDLYDLASVTKAAATSLAIMKLYDEGQIDLKAQVREYLPELKKRMIGRYTIEQLLSHHTGLQSDLPLENLLGRQFVADEIRDEFTIPVGPDSYLDENMPATIRERLTGKIGRTRRLMYRYSDLNYYLLQLAVEAIAEEPMDELLKREFYTPLGLGKIGFRPAGLFPENRMVPTIYDQWMRGGLMRGYVHDEGAALLGGVAGHAGLFGNARQLGRLFQLLNDGGEYAGRQLISAETVELFTSRSRYNYRALGFDRLAGGWPNLVNAGASDQTFGHLGFSGTSVWSDPENDLIYVLLTNRVFPDAKNQKFQKMQIRGKVHREVYRALDTWDVES